jgi:hypothetical protein
MKISTEKFLQSSGSKNLDLLAAVRINAAKLSQTKMMLMQKSKKLSAENIQLLGRAKNDSAQFYQRGFNEGYQKAFLEGVSYAKELYKPQQNLLSNLLSNTKKKEDGGTLNQGEISMVGEAGPELMVAKQDVNIIPNEDVKFVPPSITNTTSTRTIVRTIIKKQGTKIVNRTKIM